MCLEAGRGRRGRIACTQPRRIAAVTIAARIAEEMGDPVGRTVGYKIRFDDRTTRETRIKILTDGMLLAETQSDPRLREYDTLIIDEAHERSLNIDFLLGIVKTLLPVRPDLKLIITSATLDIEKFRRAFDDAPVLQVGGRMYPVEVEYRPPDPEDIEDGEADYVESAVKAVERSPPRPRRPATSSSSCPRSRTSSKPARSSRASASPASPSCRCSPAFPAAEQGRVYSVTGPKIVVATNVAETSLTIPAHQVRRRHGPGPHRPVPARLAHQQPAHPADLPELRRPAQGPLRPRPGRRLRPPLRRGRLRRRARASPRPRSSARTWPRSSSG